VLIAVELGLLAAGGAVHVLLGPVGTAETTCAPESLVREAPLPLADDVAAAMRLEGRPDTAPPAPPPKPAAKPTVLPASARFPAPTRSVSVDDRWRDSLDVLGRVARPADRAAMQRHLRRFLPPSKRWSLGGDGGRNWSDGLLGRIPSDRDRVTDVEPLPVVDVEASEERRVEQLENLRQRDAVGLLDAIHSGLAWMALHQAPDGAVSEAATAARCKELKHAPACVAAAPPAHLSAAIASTALAILAFLDFRDQDAVGLFEPYLAKAVQWLLRQQRPDGSFESPGHWRIYTTAMALMALGHTAAATGDERIKAAVAKGLKKFDETPGAGGGFRYTWGNDADLSVTAWVAQAVESARAAGVEVPHRLETNLRWFLDVVWVEQHRFLYRDRDPRERVSLSPAGMLMGRILWPQIPEETLVAWHGWLRNPGWRNRPSLYTVYYGARMSILLEGALRDPWRTWSLEIAESQTKKGANAGSFPVALDPHARRFGPSVITPLAVLTLEHALYLR
jgi:hypothetical protein